MSNPERGPHNPKRLDIVHRVDLAVVLSLLLGLLLVPVVFLVPFNDEWLRINYLADHSVWEWTVMHSVTWVVRPTSEVIMGVAALPNTRAALGPDFTAEAFLRNFRLVYVALALGYCALHWLNAVILRGKWLAREETALILLAALACWLTSEEPGFGFYWIDGYGNVLMPFAFLSCGLGLLARSQTLWRALGAAAFIVLAALGHETLCIYALGVLCLFAALRRPSAEGWARWSVVVGLLVICAAVLAAQLFSDGPRVRGQVFERSTGGAYHYDVALKNVLQIKPVAALLALLTPIFGVAIYRDQLGDLPQRAAADFARNRVFWVLLPAGTLLTSVLPLASVGLVKGQVVTSLYSTLTHLFLVLSGFLLCPMLDRWIERYSRRYRRRVGTLLPVVLLLCVTSVNRETFTEAVVRRAELQAQAHAYMEKLFTADKRVTVCRPKHPYVKPGRGMTDRGEQEYFHLERVRQRCPK
jgi:hypothetical protein